ncbi:hypothetical protein ACNRBH_20840 [Ralstonia pseudosolanacearum]|uniref:hypothetical protein n=1 Tax=Ralstonia pseudosolanacearum TaxID=1310165 RepID=UPI0026751064|nr:hypothetical protein [Ralstonia pseudosolanacearum]MDO3529912.1 hypothetical protein [Ralstonia pseudosolanacearum]MDO3532700.1 hypothetical protein [Ralstonia pseudosolanacearum]
MSNFNNTMVSVTGKGNHVGDKVSVTNKVTNNNSHNHNYNQVTNMYREPPRNGGGTDSALPAAALFGALAVWQFFRHYEQLMSAMQHATALAVVPSLIAAVIAFIRDKDAQPAAMSTFPAIVFALAGYLMLLVIGGNIPKEIETLAASGPAIQFWRSLTQYGHQVVLQSSVAIVLVLMATVSNAMAGLRTFATTNYGWFEWLWKLTWRNSPRRHVVTQVLLLGGAAFFASGKAIAAWAWLQELIRAAVV